MYVLSVEHHYYVPRVEDFVVRIYSFGAMYAPCTYRMTGDSYRRRFRLLLCSCDVFGALINSHYLLVLHTIKRPYTGLILFQTVTAIIVLNTFPASGNPLCLFRFCFCFYCYCLCFPLFLFLSQFESVFNRLNYKVWSD